jgi:hypothetical protein
MQQASRIAIIGFLALVQLFAPLVHAHAGGGQASGRLHIPGLEFLGRLVGHFIEHTEDGGDSLDVIVVPSLGLKNPGGHALASPDTSANFAAPATPAIHRPAGRDFVPLGQSPPVLLAWLQPSTRAPPRLFE